MSLLLIDEAHIFSAIAREIPSRHSQSPPSQSNPQENLSDKSNLKLTGNSNLSCKSSNEQDQRLLLPLLRGHDLLFALEGSSRILLRIVTPQGCFLRLGNTRSLPQFCMRAWQVISQLQLGLVTVSVNRNSGELALRLPICIPTPHTDRTHSQALIDKIWKTYAQYSLPLVEYIVAEAEQQGATTHQNSSKVRTLGNIFRYMEMLQISSRFNQSRLETEQDAIEKERKRREDIRRTRERKVVVPECMWRSSGLFDFRHSFSSLVPVQERDFELQHEQSRFVRWMLVTPVQFKPKNPFQNLMVLNHIHIQNMDTLKLKKINAGGFSTIFLTEVSYLYVYSSEDHEQMHPQEADPPPDRPSKVLHKYMVVKQEVKDGFSRNVRELQVLKRIKNGVSIFLPKYYVVTNRDNPHSDCLFMDFIASRNLKEYLHTNTASISLLTKLYLAFSILQGLRYIRDYHIVHLDLKPNNVMIYCNMLVKLIDFGEAYHPELPPHRPGYTIPYSPPELYTRGSKFTTKSDVFSFGVLLFEMLYNAYPYDIFTPTKLVPSAMQQHLSQWYYAPEQSLTFGEGWVMRILTNIISRCMASNPSDRPELDWMALVIKHCFELLQ